MTDETRQLLSDLAEVFDRHNAKVDIWDGEVVAYLRSSHGYVSLYFNSENKKCDTINADTFREILERHKND